MNFDAYSFIAGILFLGLSFLSCFVYERGPSKPLRVARVGVLLSLALTLGLLESLLPDMLLPGLRLGLSNIAILLVLWVYGGREAFAVAALKAVLGSLLRGSIFSMGGWMALSGTLCSFAVMASLHFLFRRLTPIAVSVLGAVVHVSAQVVVAYFYLGVGVWGYLPWLALASIVTGAITGTACVLLLRNKALVRYLRGEKTLPE